MADSGAMPSFTTYIKAFLVGGVTMFVFYFVADYARMGYLAPGAQTAALAGGLSALLMPKIMSMTSGSMPY